MALMNVDNFISHIPRQGALLGIDPGKKRVGLALSDVSRMIASPYKTIKRQKLALMVEELRSLVKQEEIVGIVTGLPLSLDGHFGPAAQAARDWATRLCTQLDLPGCLWDERLSTSIMEDFLIEKANLSRKRRFEVIDKMAATYILQTFLDADLQIRPS